MTGAEKVLKWMNKFYQVNGTPNYQEIVAQLEMAIEEEKMQFNYKGELYELKVEKVVEK